MPSFIIGVDLGKTHDYTAINVLEVDGEGRERAYKSRHLERMPSGTSYPEQVAHVADLFGRLRGPEQARLQDPDLALLEKLPGGVPEGLLPPLPGRPELDLVVDQTGVGQAVVDMMRDQGLPARAVTITGGDAVTKADHRTFRVPKRELVGTLQVVMQSRRLQIAKSNPHATRLLDELLAFKVSVNQRGHDAYGNDWRENPHDDLVLATALAVWYGETQKTTFQAFAL